MSVDEILAEYKIDSILDDTKLDEEARKCPALHQKYLLEYAEHKKALKKLQQKYAIYRRDMWEYYSGRMSQEKLKEYNLLPFGHRVLKGDIDKYLSSDTKLQSIETLVETEESTLDVLVRIINEINNRQWQIKNMIEWRRWTAGGS